MDLGISEALGKVGSGYLQGSTVGKAAKALSRKLTNTENWEKLDGKTTLNAGSKTSLNPGENFAQASARVNAGKSPSKPAPIVDPNAGKQTLADKAKAISAKNSKSVIDQVGRDWSDNEPLLSNAGKLVKELPGTISKLGEARDSLISSYDGQLTKKKEQIKGNRELIEKNQRTTLGDQAEALRKSIFNTSLQLGPAANSSAAGAAARALSEAMGKNRAAVLTQTGDQISQENQNEENADEEYQLMRKAAYDWEEQQRNELEDDYRITKAALDRLKSKVPDWKKADIENESENKLQEFLKGISEISATAKNYRNYINGIITGKFDEARQIDASSIGIDAPAALDTPEFSDDIEMPIGEGEVDENATDFYKPNNKGKKRTGTEVFGNPLTLKDAMSQ